MKSDTNDEFARQFRSAFRRAFLSDPQKQRKAGCPSDATLKALALTPGELPNRGELTEHVIECSRCFSEVNRWRRRRRVQLYSFGFVVICAAIGTVLVVSPIDLYRGTKRPGELRVQVSSAPASVALQSDTMRGGPRDNANTVVIAGESTVSITLNLTQDTYAQYRVLLQTPDGIDVRRFEKLASQPTAGGGKTVMITVPASVLKNGTYILKLSGQIGQEEHFVNSYSLRVLR